VQKRLDGENIDELLDEALSNGDDVYSEEDF